MAAGTPQQTIQYGRSLAEAGIIRLDDPQTPAEQHIFALAGEADAEVFIHTHDFTVYDCSASPAKPELKRKAKIHLAPLSEMFSELVALHELGHLHKEHGPERFRHGTAEELACECEAWDWALDHTRTALTADEQIMLATVVARRAWCSIIDDGHPAPAADDHVWTLITAVESLDLGFIGEQGRWFRRDLEDRDLLSEFRSSVSTDSISSRALASWLRCR